MAASYQSTQLDGNTSGTSSTITKPTSTTTNDLLIAMISTSNGVIATPPSDTVPWTSVTSNSRCQIFYKVAGSSEPSSYAFTFAESNGYSSTISRFTGHDLTTPINTSANAGASSSTVTISGGITPTVANCLLCIFDGISGAGSGITTSAYAVANNNPTWTERYDNQNNNASAAMATGLYAPTTTTGNATATLSASRAYGAMILAIAPGLDVTIAADLVTMTGTDLEPDFYQNNLIDISLGTLEPNSRAIWTDQTKHSSTWTDQTKN